LIIRPNGSIPESKFFLDLHIDHLLILWYVQLKDEEEMLLSDMVLFFTITIISLSNGQFECFVLGR